MRHPSSPTVNTHPFNLRFLPPPASHSRRRSGRVRGLSSRFVSGVTDGVEDQRRAQRGGRRGRDSCPSTPPDSLPCSLLLLCPFLLPLSPLYPLFFLIPSCFTSSFSSYLSSFSSFSVLPVPPPAQQDGTPPPLPPSASLMGVEGRAEIIGIMGMVCVWYYGK